MNSAEVIEAIGGLADPDSRRQRARELARLLGGDDVVLLVRDPDLGTLLPARGYPRTLRGGTSWRRFVRECAAPGRHRREVELPAGNRAVALAQVTPQMAFVLLGQAPTEESFDLVSSALSLLGGVLTVEMQLAAVEAEARLARQAAEEARSLSRSLDTARAELAKLNSELHQQDRRKDEFLAMLAHELRNPLAPLVTSIEGLRREPDGDGVRSLLDVMTRQIHQMSRLIEDLLDVARITQGRVQLRRELFDIGAAITDAIEECRPLIEARSHRLRFAPGEEPAWIDGDRVRITQIFTNLLRNAAKFTPPGGDIALEVEREGESVQVKVIDSGIGMSEEMITHAFDLFRQGPVSADRPHAGLGIGLTLVRTLVELHEGEVSAESAGTNRGTEVRVRLPAAAPPRISPALAAAARATTRRGNLRILVVDDNQDAADTLASLLETLGHRVDTAYSGLGALQLVIDIEPELVLLDIGLPELDGYAVARRLRRLLSADTCIVAVTGYGSRSDRQRSRDAGFDEHLVKPVSPGDLYALLERLQT